MHHSNTPCCGDVKARRFLRGRRAPGPQRCCPCAGAGGRGGGLATRRLFPSLPCPREPGPATPNPCRRQGGACPHSAQLGLCNAFTEREAGAIMPPSLRQFSRVSSPDGVPGQQDHGPCRSGQAPSLWDAAPGTEGSRTVWGWGRAPQHTQPLSGHPHALACDLWGPERGWLSCPEDRFCVQLPLGKGCGSNHVGGQQASSTQG